MVNLLSEEEGSVSHTPVSPPGRRTLLVDSGRGINTTQP